MSDTALATADKPAAEPKHYRISQRVKKACEALAGGKVKTITAAAELVKMSREELSRAISKPHVSAYLHQKACRALAMAAGRAAAVKVELLDSDSDHVRDSASEYVLALAGIKPATSPQVSVNIELKAGYVIDLSGRQPMRAINADVPKDGV